MNIEPLKDMINDKSLPVFATMTPLGKGKLYPVCEACQDIDNTLDADTSCFVLISCESTKNLEQTPITVEQLEERLVKEGIKASPLLLIDGGSHKDFMPVRYVVGAYEYGGKFVVIGGDVIEEEDDERS